MSAWTLAALGSRDWSPAPLLVLPSPWSDEVALTRLGDVATVHSVTAPLDAALPLVTPQNINPTTGALTPLRVVDDEGLVLGDDLRVNDVLVPTYGSGLCIRVSEETKGITFRGFLVVRALDDRVDSSWLWGYLSSVSGVAAREAVAVSAAVVRMTPAALADVRIPMPPIQQARGVFDALVPQPLVCEQEPSAIRSRWSFRVLNDRPWLSEDATASESVGIELSELGESWGGTVAKQECFASPAHGRTRVLTSQAVRGHRQSFEAWATGQRITTAETVVFTRTEPFRAVRAPIGVLLAKELIAIDLNDRANTLVRGNGGPAEALATYFRGTVGSGALVSASSGSALRQLSLSALRSLRVPEKLAVPPQEGSGGTPLSVRLEDALRGALAR